MALCRPVRAGAGTRHFHRSCFSGGGADVSGRVSSHLLRSWLLAQILVRRDGYENRGVEVSEGAQHAAAARVRREG